MKYFLLILFYFFKITASAQSPYTSVLIKMDSVRAANTRYKIEMKICEIKSSERGDWFKHDTSKINFTSLKATDLKCGNYFDVGSPATISGQKEKNLINQFEYRNQLFAWEHVFVYKVSDMLSIGDMPVMYIVIPVKYKSFRTKINISDIEFQSGKVVFLTDIEGKYDDKLLTLSQSLRGKKGVAIKDFTLKEFLEKN